METKYDAAGPKNSRELNPDIKIKELDYKKAEYAKLSLGKAMNYEFWARCIERGKNYVGLLQQFIRNPDAESSFLAVCDESDVSRGHSASRLAEEERIKENTRLHLSVYRPENPPQNISDIAKRQKAGRNFYSPYNPKYPNGYPDIPIADDSRKGIFSRTADYFRRMRQGDGKKPEVYNSNVAQLPQVKKDHQSLEDRLMAA